MNAWLNQHLLAARDASRYTIDLLTKRLQDAEARLSSFEGRQVTRESQEIDARLGMAQQAWNIAEQARRRAVANSDMAAYDAAMRDMQAAESTFNQLRGVKARISQVVQPVQQEAAPDPRVVGLAQEFADRNDWYDPDGKDEDSAIVNTIDNRLAAEGWDPTTAEYWDELQRRVDVLAAVFDSVRRSHGIAPATSMGLLQNSPAWNTRAAALGSAQAGAVAQVRHQHAA